MHVNSDSGFCLLHRLNLLIGDTSWSLSFVQLTSRVVHRHQGNILQVAFFIPFSCSDKNGSMEWLRHIDIELDEHLSDSTVR